MTKTGFIISADFKLQKGSVILKLDNRYSQNDSERRTQYRRNVSGQVSHRPSSNTNSRNGARRPNPKTADGTNKMPSEKRAKSELTAEERKKLAQKQAKRNKLLKIGAVIVSISLVFSLILISCLNDILAINRSTDNIIDVTISEDANGNVDTKSVITALKKAKLIKNKYFCIVAAKLLGYTDKNYRTGEYSLTPSMGLENMLDSIKNKNSSAAKTVALTFPEGYSMNQILQKLEDEKVCSKEKMINAMKTNDYSNDYDFVKLMDRPSSRYYKFEGYFYPDTYEFYIGESADSVIRKFLDNFEKRWSDTYATLAAEQSLSVDDVLTLASIVEKEGTADDMKDIASVLINRLGASMQLQCDSTKDYEDSIASAAPSAYASFQGLYNTYNCPALPVGPICNPGKDAIEAVLYHSDTGYYYFYHDSENVIHLAKTLSGHNDNMIKYP